MNTSPKPRRAYLALVLAVIVCAALNISISQAASSLTSISFSSITVHNNNCALGTAVYEVSVVVTGVANGGNFTLVEHFGGSGGPRTATTNLVDAQLGAPINLGNTGNATGWTAPNDKPQVYVEATANGVTVTTPVIEIDCATGTYTILSSGAAAQRPPDDRLNWRAGDNDAAVYVRSDDAGNPAIHIYCIEDDSKGQLGLIVTEDALAGIDASPTVNELVAESSTCAVSFYVLTSGEYQINIGPDSEGKSTILIFEGLTAGNLYTQSIAP